MSDEVCGICDAEGTRPGDKCWVCGLTAPVKTPAEAPDLYRVTVADGKYTFVQPATGGLKCLRYGEEWRSLEGDGAVLALVQEVDNLRTTLREFRDAVAEDYVCELNSTRRPLWERVAELLVPLEKDYDK